MIRIELSKIFFGISCRFTIFFVINKLSILYKIYDINLQNIPKYIRHSKILDIL